MPYLVDGHNLIPKIGLRLDSMDDELELIEILLGYARQAATSIEVFFDGAPPGGVTSRRFGRVTAIFVSRTSSADAAIRRRVQALRGEARNWTVVSSDREVRQAAKDARAQVATSEEFASKIRIQRGAGGVAEAARGGRGKEGELSEEEVQRWLDVFARRKR